MKNETHQKRSFLSRLTALLLVVVLLFNMNAAALPVHAVESTNKWASSPKDNLNTLPSYAKGGDGVERQPDVGTAASKGGEISSTAENKTEAAIQDQTVTVNRLGGTVTLSPKGGSFDRAAYTDCAVRYTNVYPNTDYQSASVDGEAQVKILWEGPEQQTDFAFSLGHSENLVLKSEALGYAAYKGLTRLLTVSNPVAMDNGGAIGETSMSLTEDGTLSVHVDETWLNDLSRTYPVSVSFTIGSYQALSSGRAFSAAPRKAAEDCPYDLKPDVTYDDNKGSRTRHMMTFNSLTIIPAEGATPPEGSEESEMSLRIEDKKSGAELETLEDIELDMPIDYEFEPGIYYQLYLIVDGEEIELDHFLIYEVTGLLKSGVAFIGYRYEMEDPEDLEKDNQLDNTKNLIQPESTVFIRNPNLNLNPAMQIGNPTEEELAAIVAWLLGKGVTDVCAFGLEPINYNTGNFLYTAEDASLPDYAGEFSLERTYNSLGGKLKGSFGYGWEFAYDISLSVRSGGIYVLHLGDGRTVWFQWNGSEYVSDSDKHYTFAQTGNGYAVTNAQDKTVYSFNWNGELTSIADAGGSTALFAYADHKLIEITTPAGYEIGVECDEDGRITALTLPDGRIIQYAYDASGNLASVTDQENQPYYLLYI